MCVCVCVCVCACLCHRGARGDTLYIQVRIPRRDWNGTLNEDGAEYVVYDEKQVVWAVALQAAEHDTLQVLRVVLMTQQQYERYVR